MLLVQGSRFRLQRFRVQRFRPALARQQGDKKFFNIAASLDFHRHILKDQVWARGSEVQGSGFSPVAGRN
jgi:hypothetical protein